MSVKPWKNGWLEYNTRSGWMRWLSSLGTTVESVRIFGGMIVVISKASSICPEYVILPNNFREYVSGYRHASGSLLSVFWQRTKYPRTSSSKSATPLFESLDATAAAASPTLAALRLVHAEIHGKPE
jgi:hypothetical protein